MAEYNKLKSMLLDMQHKSRTDSKQTFENAMDQRRAMVDTMFEYLDLNQDGRLSGGELTEVRYAQVIILFMRWHKAHAILRLMYKSRLFSH